MAVDIRELIESRETRRESGGRISTTRVFQADTTPDLVTPANVIGLPDIDDPLPWYIPPPGSQPQLVFSVIASYERGSVTTSRIIVSYSNDPPTWGGINPADPFFKGWDQDYYRVAQPIPYAVESSLGHAWMDNTNTMQFITEYPVAYTTFWESRKRFIRHVRITNFTNAQWEPIGDMSNTLMRIYQRWYLFTLGSVIQSARNVWDTTYTMEFDAGTPDVLNSNTTNNLLINYPGNMLATVPAGGFPQAALWARPPYHEVSLIPGRNAGTQMPDWPTWVVTCPYGVNENGWQSLPGFGPL